MVSIVPVNPRALLFGWQSAAALAAGSGRELGAEGHPEWFP